MEDGYVNDLYILNVNRMHKWHRWDVFYLLVCLYLCLSVTLPLFLCLSVVLSQYTATLALGLYCMLPPSLCCLSLYRNLSLSLLLSLHACLYTSVSHIISLSGYVSPSPSVCLSNSPSLSYRLWKKINCSSPLHIKLFVYIANSHTENNFNVL